LTDINPSGRRSDRRAVPWADCPAATLAGVRGICTDIDDTLTRDGDIEPVALAALQALREAGLPVIAVTGRPTGWSMAFARDWPVEAIVAENGAVALRADRSQRSGVRVDYLQDASTRALNQERLRATAQRILRQMPQVRLAQDSAGRVTDIAVDHSEQARLDEADIARVVALMREAGMTATVSSIHVNGWYGDHDKWSGAQWAVRLLYGRALAEEVDRWLFVGDSTNDQVMFEQFRCSVGVANLRRFAEQLRVWPAYVTEGERGVGFAEAARAVLAARA
jgi:HAD superfamily hydrolase (TIGR01484 family)